MVKRNSCKAWLLAARPVTLASAAVPVMIGLSMAWNDAGAGRFSVVAGVLCLLFAFIMQIDANFVNDYFDFKKGTDNREMRLGPERACSQGWVSTRAMMWGIAATTLLACLIGFPLVFFGGWHLLAVGVLCVLFCFLYTTYFSYVGLGDVLVLVFFGLVPVTMTYYVQVQSVSLQALIASLACGLVIDGLLLVNNFRDRDTDKQAGKTTLVVHIGPEAALWVYAAVGIVACLMGLYFAVCGHLWAFLLPLVYLLLHLRASLDMQRIWSGRELNKLLGVTARNIFIYGLLLSVGFLL